MKYASMKLTDYPGWVQHALCVFESLRRLDFEPQEIFFEVLEQIRRPGIDVAEEAPTAFCVTVRTTDSEARRLFTYAVARLKEEIGTEDRHEIARVFREAVKLWNAKTPEAVKERASLYDTNNFIDNVALVSALVERDMYPRTKKASALHVN